MAFFAWSVRVYYEDTDAGGVVYHANYLRFMERVRNEWVRSSGQSVTDIAEKLNLLFLVKRVEIEYRAPARLDDQLQITAEIKSARRTSMVIEQQVIRDGQILIEAEITLVMVDATTFRPQPLPDFILKNQ